MNVLETIAGLFNFFMLIVIMAIGLYTLWADVSKLRKRGFYREMKIAKVIAYLYIFGGLISFVALRIFV